MHLSIKDDVIVVITVPQVFTCGWTVSGVHSGNNRKRGCERAGSADRSACHYNGAQKQSSHHGLHNLFISYFHIIVTKIVLPTILLF